MDNIAMILLAPILVSVAVHDLKHMRIPNYLTVVSLVILGALALVSPPDDLLVRLTVAVSVLALGVVGFAFRLIGGGDVKILSAMMLAVPSSELALFGNVFSLSMFVGIGVVLAVRRIPQSTNWGWKSFGGSNGFPMGLSIAMAGLSFPLVSAVFG